MSMKFKWGLTILVVVGVFVGLWIIANYNTVNLTFVGGSDHWKGTYIITGDHKLTNEELTLTYEGVETPIDSVVNFTFNSSSRGGKVDGTKLGRDKIIKFQSSGTGDIPTDNEEIDLIIQWDDKQEVLILKSTNKK